MSSIKITQLRKVYGESIALRDIDLEVADGEVMALLGPSGCGKTTTLQLLAGFLKPDGGEIRGGDRVVSTSRSGVPPHRESISTHLRAVLRWRAAQARPRKCRVRTRGAESGEAGDQAPGRQSPFHGASGPAGRSLPG